MGIIWIRDGSPLTIVAEDDDGNELDRMEVDLQGRDVDWEITEVDDSPGKPVSGRKFRMSPRRGPGGEEFQLRLEFGDARKP